MCLKRTKEASESLKTCSNDSSLSFPLRTTGFKLMRICNFRDISLCLKNVSKALEGFEIMLKWFNVNFTLKKIAFTIKTTGVILKTIGFNRTIKWTKMLCFFHIRYFNFFHIWWRHQGVNANYFGINDNLKHGPYYQFFYPRLI